jgi:hypothetical protein
MTSSSPLRRGGAPALGVVGRLTERDRFLCRILWEHRVLTTEQVLNLCFTSLSAAQHRLVALWRLDVLERFRSLRPVGSESWRYTLGPLGATVVAAERGVDPQPTAVLRDRVVALAAGQRTKHTLGVNGFFCALHAAARRQQNAAIGAWWSERKCMADWGDFVRPDAYGAWTEGSATVEFFLEYDTGTETIGRLTGKLAGYRDLAEGDGSARPVLFWLKEDGREPALRRALAGCELPVATAVAKAGNPAEAVWLPVGVESPCRRLAELSGRPAAAVK